MIARSSIVSASRLTPSSSARSSRSASPTAPAILTMRASSARESGGEWRRSGRRLRFRIHAGRIRRAGLVVGSGKSTRPRVTYHGLRHTAATAMLTAGTPAVVVAAQLGHASSAITHAVYEHLLDDTALDAAVRSVRVAGGVAGTETLEEQETAKPA
jgi:integrase